jgi:hypothetical protein
VLVVGQSIPALGAALFLMNKMTTIKLIVALALLGGASFMFVGFFRHNSGVVEKAFFYDLSEKKLFAVSREELPPIRGLNDAEEDAVRAVVIAPNGNPDDKAHQKIAYLEKYAPELKEHLAKVRDGKAEPLPRGARDSYRFVKRETDRDWYKVSSPEGEKILAEWNVPGPDGKFPVVCTP